MLDALFINQYLVEVGKQPKHAFYNDSVKIAKSLQNHSKGHYPADLINIVRPNETADQKEYRKQVYTPKTKTYFSKIVTTLSKIQRAEDWDINFEDSDNSFEKTFPLKDYTEEKYPSFGSVSNWFFSVQMREMCDDPNGVIAVYPLPKENPEDDTELLRPFSTWFPSSNVIDFVEGKYCVLLSEETAPLKDANQNVLQGRVYYFFDKDSWAISTQVGDPRDNKFSTVTAEHNLGEMPAFKIGGIIEEFKAGQKLYDSFIGDCIPDWNEAIRRYSDLQVQMVLHVHSEKWEIEDSPCKVCNETGTVMSGTAASSKKVSCGNCNGTGSVSQRSPFGVKQIKPIRQTGLNDSVTIPTPPMGYIQKPIQDTEFIDKQVDKSIESGLAAINMEFIMYEPEVNSGIAKTLDRQEINTFFYEVGRHITQNILTPTYRYIAEWRYGMQLNTDEINKVLPEINTPTQFDILTGDILAERLKAAQDSNIDPSLKMALQIDWAKAEFGDESEEVEFIKCVAELDPLPAKTDDEKMTMLSNKGISQNSYIVSCNLTSFIRRAMFENKDFDDFPNDKKQEIISGYAQEIIDDQESAKVPIMPLNPVDPSNPNLPIPKSPATSIQQPVNA